MQNDWRALSASRKPEGPNLMLRILLGVAAAAALIVFLVLQWKPATTAEFVEIASLDVDGNAEILAVSADGRLLVHTNAKRRTVDVVDLSNPEQPATLSRVSLPGEPTSVGLSEDGLWALATVHVKRAKKGKKPPDLRLPGVLAVIDLRDPTAAQVASIIGIDNHPDSIAVTSNGDDLVAVIAIENEPVWVKDDVVVDEDDSADATDISYPGVIQIVTLNPAAPRNWGITTLELSAKLLNNALLLASDDPQPEFVALSPGRHMAAVSLQENNGIVLVDLSTPEISSVFNLGSVVNRLADLTNNKKISMTENYPGDAKDHALAGVRTPDAIAFTPDGQYLLSADEGEAVMTGGRGFSIWSLTGEFVWDDGGEIERRAVEMSMYPDDRSGKKGVEIEGITAARFGSRDFAFAVSETGSFMVVYDISNPYEPRFVQMLPTGSGPESVATVPALNLIIVAAEESGTLTVFRYVPAATAESPLLKLLQ
jgi:DNA-binding beta-propeller fold protein YncE